MRGIAEYQFIMAAVVFIGFVTYMASQMAVGGYATDGKLPIAQITLPAGSSSCGIFAWVCDVVTSPFINGIVALMSLSTTDPLLAAVVFVPITITVVYIVARLLKPFGGS